MLAICKKGLFFLHYATDSLNLFKSARARLSSSTSRLAASKSWMKTVQRSTSTAAAVQAHATSRELQMSSEPKLDALYAQRHAPQNMCLYHEVS